MRTCLTRLEISNSMKELVLRMMVDAIIYGALHNKESKEAEIFSREVFTSCGKMLELLGGSQKDFEEYFETVKKKAGIN